MRVIGGLFRSRLLVSPPGSATRPTSDRLRETLFNILAARRPLEGCRFADLYAGTGAVGIEAISRGAAHCWFAEKAAPPLKALRANLGTLKIASSAFTIEERGTGALLAALGRKSIALNVIFLDPPYDAEAEYEATLNLLGSATGRHLVAPRAVVVAECASKGSFSLAERYGSLTRTRVHKQGDTSLAFYEAGAGTNAPPV